MGLDNGIVIKLKPDSTREYSDLVKSIKSFFLYHDFLDSNNPQICYWRKCWNVREIFLKCLNNGKENDSCYYQIEKDDIEPIIKKLIKILNKEEWESDGNSIWEFEEYLPKMITDLANLKLLIKFMDENQDVVVYFYDSF